MQKARRTREHKSANKEVMRERKELKEHTIVTNVPSWSRSTTFIEEGWPCVVTLSLDCCQTVVTLMYHCCYTACYYVTSDTRSSSSEEAEGDRSDTMSSYCCCSKVNGVNHVSEWCQSDFKMYIEGC
jgi:hypothetical protein